MKRLPTLEEIEEAELALSRGMSIEPEFPSLSDLLVYEASRNSMMSRVDHILDRHIDDVEKGDTIENMLVEAATEFLKPSETEKNTPVRSIQSIQIEYKDYLLMPHAIFLDNDGKRMNPIVPTQKRYAKELTFNTQNKTHIGVINIYGEKLSGYDKGFVNSFAEKLNTAILSFNRRKFYMEKDAMLLSLNSIMDNENLTIEERRQKMIDDITSRIKAEEGYVVLVKDGRKPTTKTIAADDLEIKETNGCHVPDMSEEKKDYILEKAVFVIKTPEEVDVFDDAKDKYGYCLATELKINETGKIGGAFVLFDRHEFLHSKQKLAEAAGLKVDDYIIFNMEMREEKELGERMKKIFIPMLGKEQAEFLLQQKDPKDLSQPQLKKVVIMLTDMKGSTKVADDLSEEGEKLGDENLLLQIKINRYVDAIDNYLEPGSEAAKRFGGALDKYIGDCVMAVWGIPIGSHDMESMARSAILAAVYANILTIKYNQRVDKERVKDDSIIKLEQRVILHCGKALAGVYGTEMRRCYTIMGACVNEANRIEGLPVAETGKVTMSHTFYTFISDVAEAECVGEFSLKGKAKPVKIYHFKNFKLNGGDFKAFAMQYASPLALDIFKRNTFFKDFVEGKYLSETYLNQWALPATNERPLQ